MTRPNNTIPRVSPRAGRAPPVVPPTHAGGAQPLSSGSGGPPVHHDLVRRARIISRWVGVWNHEAVAREMKIAPHHAAALLEAVRKELAR